MALTNLVGLVMDELSRLATDWSVTTIQAAPLPPPQNHDCGAKLDSVIEVLAKISLKMVQVQADVTRISAVTVQSGPFDENVARHVPATSQGGSSTFDPPGPAGASSDPSRPSARKWNFVY